MTVIGKPTAIAELDPETLTFALLALDALTARIAEDAGFSSVYVSGVRSATHTPSAKRS